VYLVDHKQLDAPKEKEVIDPAPCETVPLFGRRQDEMRRCKIAKGLSRITISSDESNFKSELHRREAVRPILVSLLAESLTRRHVYNLAMLGHSHVPSSSGGIVLQINGKEPSHGHFKDSCLSSTSRSRDNNIVVAIRQSVTNLGLELVECIKLGLPKAIYGRIKDLRHGDATSSVDWAVGGRKVVHHGLGDALVRRWCIQ
jgi:hypothetical protein